MTTVALGTTGTYTFSAGEQATISLDPTERALVTVTSAAGLLRYSSPVGNGEVIGGFSSGDVLSITAIKGDVDYVITGSSVTVAPVLVTTGGAESNGIMAAQLALLKGGNGSSKQSALASVNGHDLLIDGPVTRLGLTSPYSSYYGTYDQEFAYGTPIYFSQGFAGFRYWMASAPYPYGLIGQGCTISVATPAVITEGAGSPPAGTQITFSTTGALPTGLDTITVYYVSATGRTDRTYQISLTPGGTSINTTGTQSGTHQVWVTGGQCLVSVATPGVVACAKSLPIGTPFTFATTGTLPTGAVAGNVYYVLATGWTATGFQFSQTQGGAAIATTGTSSGYQTFFVYAPKFENPYIQVSQDGINFAPAPGLLANPISDQFAATGNDAASYYADPYIVASLDQKTLYCVWHWFSRAGTNKSTILVSETQDGKTWTTPVAISNSTSAGFMPNSVSLIPTATGWTMVAVDTGAVGQPLIYSKTTNPTPYTGWTAPGAVYSGEWTQCNAVHPLARKWWHQYTIAVDGGGLLMLASDNAAAGGTAWSLVSADGGANWSVRAFSAYSAATPGGVWYRPGICVIDDGAGAQCMRLYASTLFWPHGPALVQPGGDGFFIFTGLLKSGRTMDLMMRAATRDLVSRKPVAPVALSLNALVAWDSFTRADGAVGNAESGQAWSVVSGTYAIATNQLSCTGSGIITINPGVQNFDMEFRLVTTAVGGNNLVLFNYQDSSNRMRWGLQNGVVAFDRVSGGGITFTASCPIVPVNGDLIRFSKRGPFVSIYINDLFAYSYYDTLLVEQTTIGFQLDTGAVIDNFIVYQA